MSGTSEPTNLIMEEILIALKLPVSHKNQAKCPMRINFSFKLSDCVMKMVI